MSNFDDSRFKDPGDIAYADSEDFNSELFWDELAYMPLNDSDIQLAHASGDEDNWKKLHYIRFLVEDREAGGNRIGRYIRDINRYDQAGKWKHVNGMVCQPRLNPHVVPFDY